MPSLLLRVIQSDDATLRNRSLATCVADLDLDALLEECEALEAFWRRADNLYERVRALFFLHALHRFHLPPKLEYGSPARRGPLPQAGFEHLLERRFSQAIDTFLELQKAGGPSDACSSALAVAYRQLGFETLATQVRASVRELAGNRWMFEVPRPTEQPLEFVTPLLQRELDGYPVLEEQTPVRMDLSHAGWSDIFFLGMDRPEAAKVLNVSIDLSLLREGTPPTPPVRARLRAIDEPCLRLVSTDLEARADITRIEEVFDFARDYLGLLKAAVIASGLVPPSLEGQPGELCDLLAKLVGPGRGIELESCVRGIPKGSRMAVSTSLLASLIALCMRATGQTRALEGPLRDEERRTIVGRAILGEWLGGSGGGWQDSGGLWPSFKLISGALARPGDAEFGKSRGRLLPDHELLDDAAAPEEARRKLCESLVLVHGGIAQDVGPVLEMVTERYLLRSQPEWDARQEALHVFGRVQEALARADIAGLARATTDNFFGPLQTILPWASDLFTQRLVELVRQRYADDFLGFWMLGGMAGGGMGFFFRPQRRDAIRAELEELMVELKRELQHGLPFAIDPVVYDFRVNELGSVARLMRSTELGRLSRSASVSPEPDASRAQADAGNGAVSHGLSLEQLLAQNGFDALQHEEIRADLRAGRIGLARNRLAPETELTDVLPEDVFDTRRAVEPDAVEAGAAALAAGEVAVVTLAAGVGTRWSGGASVVKALSPFARLAGDFRTFLDVHLAKSRAQSRRHGAPLPHVVTTSYLTHDPIAARLTQAAGDPLVPLELSRGRSVGLRFVPMERDLRAAWEESPQQILEERAQRVRESLQAALIGWAKARGEGEDYADNVGALCLHPVGHGYEVPNLLLSGALERVLRRTPQLSTLLLTNIDTLGADADPGLLGAHRASGRALTFEVVPRRIQDRGGGLARIDGRPRLVESLALPREEDELGLSYYNSMTTWIEIDPLLELFGLDRARLGDADRVRAAVRDFTRRLPTYVTLKNVKRRFGRGHEDVFPVAQFEKLWSDVSALPELSVGYFVVSRERGQQLKEPAELDGWWRDGSAGYVARLCSF